MRNPRHAHLAALALLAASALTACQPTHDASPAPQAFHSTPHEVHEFKVKLTRLLGQPPSRSLLKRQLRLTRKDCDPSREANPGLVYAMLIGRGDTSAAKAMKLAIQIFCPQREAALKSAVGPLWDTVTYDVTGSASGANLTYSTSSGTEQQSNLVVPLMSGGRRSPIRIGPVPSGTFLYLSAQNTGVSGSVTCSIRVGSDLIASNSARGEGAIATCQGSAP